MAYFEYEFNDYVTIRGELVAGSVDYNTRLYAPSMNDFDNSNGPVNDRMAIAVGSNPGNPFRAYADGSFVPGHLTGGIEWNPNDNNIYEFPGRYGITSEGFLRTNRASLDFIDQNGDGRYQYLSEPGEKLVFAMDIDGNGIPDRMGNDGLHDPLLDRNPAFRVMLMGMGDADGDGLEDRFDPDAGGIILMNDVRFGDGELHAFSKTRAISISTGSTTTGLRATCAVRSATTYVCASVVRSGSRIRSGSSMSTGSGRAVCAKPTSRRRSRRPSFRRCAARRVTCRTPAGTPSARRT